MLARWDERVGEVEADETAYGGKPKASMTRGMSMPEAQTFAKARKTGIMAMVERGGSLRQRACGRLTGNGALAKTMDGSRMARASCGRRIGLRCFGLAPIHAHWPAARVRRICRGSGTLHVAAANSAKGRTS